MGNEQERCIVFLLDLLHQVHDLRLDGHIQGGNGFIRNDQLRVHDQRPGDPDPLALSAGELVGIAVGVFLRQSHQLQHVVDFLPALVFRLVQLMDIQALRNDVHDLFPRVQARHGVLEDHLHVCVQKALVVLAHLPGNIPPAEGDFAVCRIVQPDDGPAGGGLAGPGFSHQAIGFSFIDVKVDAVHCLHREFPVDPEMLLESLDVQNAFRH